jgi:hypothetical protein
VEFRFQNPKESFPFLDFPDLVNFGSNVRANVLYIERTYLVNILHLISSHNIPARRSLHPPSATKNTNSIVVGLTYLSSSCVGAPETLNNGTK